MQDLDYAEMLEIPVSTVTVTKKKSLFRRREAPRDDLKERVVDSVNERVGAYVEAEDLTDPPKKQRGVALSFGKDRESALLFGEIAAVCVIAMAIFLTNIFMPNSAINTFIASLTRPVEETAEPSYSELTLSPVVSDFSDADVTLSDDGVLSFMAEGGVYPVYDGTVAAVTGGDGSYVVKIAHTSTFSSVITGLNSVYCAEGDAVKGNLPVGWSDGSAEVKIALYDGEELLDCIALSGEVPVWNL